jgi:hypothetical protein
MDEIRLSEIIVYLQCLKSLRRFTLLRCCEEKEHGKNEDFFEKNP